MSRYGKRVPKHTIAWWIRFFGLKIDLWEVSTSKWEIAGLTVSCYDPANPFSSHLFYF